MSAVSIIAKKRDGLELSPQDIGTLISGYVQGEVPDYQMAAFAMAVYLRGMNVAETTALTEKMLASGKSLHWASDAFKADKHSTGGVGDKVSLVLAPLLASCGLQVPMISGRGLGPTGGTLDKLESIPGFRANLSSGEIQTITERVGCVIAGATEDLAPADRKLYALRDVTATVASIPLITASILCKKLAEGLDALALDVKFGSGAFMKTVEHARELARSMVEVGGRMGVQTVALLTDMNQPLGRMAGNSLEVEEAVAALQGDGPFDLMEVTYSLGAELLVASKQAENAEASRAMFDRKIETGAAWEKFREMITAQGGNLNADRPIAAKDEITASRSGVVAAIDTEKLGEAIIELGGGRRLMEDAIDHSTGLEMLVRLGDEIEKGQPIVRVFANSQNKREKVQSMITDAVVIGESPVQSPPLVVERIT